jgi:poly(3-hydroxybutyrate) depolymerase
MPMVAFHGTDDRAVFFDGGYDPNVALLVGATDGPGRAEIVEDWAIGNGCTDDPSTKPIDPDVEKIEYECPSGDDVDFYVIEGGKHAWPRGGRTPPSGLAETTTTAIDASTRIWDFFTQHQRAP